MNYLSKWHSIFIDYIWISCLKEAGTKEPILKKIIKKNGKKGDNDSHLELQFQLDSRNVRLRFNSMRTEPLKEKN